MKILGIIPARSGSKRVPRKNKKLLGGKRLVEYAIQSSMSSTLLGDILLSSDDEEILGIGKTYPKLKIRRRPSNISGDDAPAITYVMDALDYLKSDYDIVVIIQPSSPFTIGDDIDATIQLLIENENADSAVSVVKLDHALQPAKIKYMQNKKLLPYFEEERNRMSAQELPELFVRNGSVYVSRIEVIDRGLIIGEDCLGYEMPRDRSIDINDPIDFEFAEYLMKKHE